MERTTRRQFGRERRSRARTERRRNEAVTGLHVASAWRQPVDAVVHPVDAGSDAVHGGSRAPARATGGTVVEHRRSRSTVPDAVTTGW